MSKEGSLPPTPHALELSPMLLVAAPRPTDSLGATDAVTTAVRALATGDADAFAAVYAAYSRMVHAILVGRIPRLDVDDLVQDVFLLAFTRIRELRDPAAFGGWLAAIARNRATDYLRRSHEHVALPDELPGGEAIATDTLAVLDVIRKLPEAYRDTLLMRLAEGMSGAEIAERTGLSPGSVRVNLSRGMKLLRERLGWRDHD
jgi:RNA polymerase sigma-70 factor (ECF subfamily)